MIIAKKIYIFNIDIWKFFNIVLQKMSIWLKMP